jgi:hypothetical protein
MLINFSVNNKTKIIRRMLMPADIKSRLEGYFIEYGLPYENIGENMWTLKDDIQYIENIVVHYSEPSIIFRVKLMEVPKAQREEFFEKLLRLNTEKMIYGAYGIEGNNVVLIDTLEAANLDYNEFAGSVDSLILAMTEDYNVLKSYIK